MKKIVFFIVLFLVCGCSANYNLEISNDSFKENINIMIDKSQIPEKSKYEGIETDDRITPFLKKEHSALISDEKAYYDKKVIYYDNYIDVNMKYNYNSNEFKDSNLLNLCFDDFVFDDKDSYYIHVFGNFYCLYGEEVNINIKTNNKVIRSNSTSVDGNVYTWKINFANATDVDIEFEVSKGFPWKVVLKYTVIVLIVLIVSGLGIYYIYKKNRENNSID